MMKKDLIQCCTEKGKIAKSSKCISVYENGGL